MPKLDIVLCNIKLKNPTILASGFLGVSASSLINVAKNTAGAVTFKSLGPEERKGHPCPVISTFNGGIINAVGLSNPGYELGAEEIKEFNKTHPVPVIASIFAFKKELFGLVAQKISLANPDFIEINISCPNVESEAGIPFACDAASAAEVTKIVKEKTKIPIIVKLSPSANNIGKIAAECERAGADAINMGNTLGPGMVINIEAAKPILSNKVGGVSGPAIKPIAVKNVWDVYNSVKIPIIGTGGVTTGRDAVEMIMAGASAVGVGSAVYYRGIDVFSKINSEILEFMKANNYKTIKEMVGLAHR
ncbi:MAG: dihydroorotate dehydrogenase [archaeon]